MNENDRKLFDDHVRMIESNSPMATRMYFSQNLDASASSARSPGSFAAFEEQSSSYSKQQLASVQSLRKQNEMKDDLIATLKQRIEVLEQERDYFQKISSETKGKVSESNTIAVQLTEANAKVLQMTTQFEGFQKEAIVMSENLIAARAQLEIANKEMLRYQSELVESKASISQMTYTIQSLESSNLTLRQNMKEMEAKILKDTNTNESARNQLLIEKRNFEERFKAMVAKLTDSDSEKNDMKLAIENMNAKLKAFDKETKRLIRDNNEWKLLFNALENENRDLKDQVTDLFFQLETQQIELTEFRNTSNESMETLAKTFEHVNSTILNVCGEFANVLTLFDNIDRRKTSEAEKRQKYSYSMLHDHNTYAYQHSAIKDIIDSNDDPNLIAEVETLIRIISKTYLQSKDMKSDVLKSLFTCLKRMLQQFLKTTKVNRTLYKENETASISMKKLTLIHQKMNLKIKSASKISQFIETKLPRIIETYETINLCQNLSRQVTSQKTEQNTIGLNESRLDDIDADSDGEHDKGERITTSNKTSDVKKLTASVSKQKTVQSELAKFQKYVSNLIVESKNLSDVNNVFREKILALENELVESNESHRRQLADIKASHERTLGQLKSKFDEQVETLSYMLKESEESVKILENENMNERERLRRSYELQLEKTLREYRVNYFDNNLTASDVCRVCCNRFSEVERSSALSDSKQSTTVISNTIGSAQPIDYTLQRASETPAPAGVGGLLLLSLRCLQAARDQIEEINSQKRLLHRLYNGLLLTKCDIDGIARGCIKAPKKRDSSKSPSSPSKDSKGNESPSFSFDSDSTPAQHRYLPTLRVVVMAVLFARRLQHSAKQSLVDMKESVAMDKNAFESVDAFKLMRFFENQSKLRTTNIARILLDKFDLVLPKDPNSHLPNRSSLLDAVKFQLSHVHRNYKMYNKRYHNKTIFNRLHEDQAPCSFWYKSYDRIDIFGQISTKILLNTLLSYGKKVRATKRALQDLEKSKVGLEDANNELIRNLIEDYKTKLEVQSKHIEELEQQRVKRSREVVAFMQELTDPESTREISAIAEHGDNVSCGDDCDVNNDTGDASINNTINNAPKWNILAPRNEHNKPSNNESFRSFLNEIESSLTSNGYSANKR